MKKLILAALMLASTLTSKAQIKLSKDFDFELSTPYEVVDGSIKSYFGNDGEILSVKVDGDAVYIQKNQKNTLNQTSSKKYEDFEKGYATENIVKFADKYYLFYSAWDKENKVEQLFVREIDFQKADFVGKGQRIIKVNEKVTGGDGNKFSITTSFDEKHLLVYYREKPEKRSDKVNKDEIGFYVFDDKMELEWNKTSKMPYTESQMNNIAYALNNAGSVFILSEVLPEGESKRLDKQNQPNYKLELLVVSQSGMEATNTEIKLNKKIVTQVGFFEGKEDLILAGYYGNINATKKSTGTDGVFMMKLNNAGELNDEVSYEIPTEIMKENLSDKAQKKLDKKEDKGIDLSLANMVLRDVVINKDGSLVLIGERYYYVTTYNSQTKTTTTTYFYEDMLITKINGDGSLAWMKKLPKKQVRTSSSAGGMFSISFNRSHGLGYKYIQGSTSHYLLFLDNVKNLELASNEAPKTHTDGQGGFLTAYKINDSDGKVEKLSILDTRDAKGTELFQFSPNRIVQVSDNVFGLECYKKKKEDVMVKITLKD